MVSTMVYKHGVIICYHDCTMVAAVFLRERLACWERSSAEGNIVSNAWLDLERDGEGVVQQTENWKATKD